jgi:hypothetical protein
LPRAISRELTDDPREDRALASSTDLSSTNKERNVAMVVLLLDDGDGAFALREDQLSQLTRLGVTSVDVFRDRQVVGVVLEGWLFDPARSARAAAVAIGATEAARTLHPLVHMAVSATNEGGRDDVQSSPT